VSDVEPVPFDYLNIVSPFSPNRLRHVAGSSFGLLLQSADVCPITDPTQAPIDTAAWGVELVLVGPVHRVVVPGVWLSSFQPWNVSFQQAETKAWPPGRYLMRLAYISPEQTPRRFEQELILTLEVVR